MQVLQYMKIYTLEYKNAKENILSKNYKLFFTCRFPYHFMLFFINLH